MPHTVKIDEIKGLYESLGIERVRAKLYDLYQDQRRVEENKVRLEKERRGSGPKKVKAGTKILKEALAIGKKPQELKREDTVFFIKGYSQAKSDVREYFHQLKALFELLKTIINSAPTLPGKPTLFQLLAPEIKNIDTTLTHVDKETGTNSKKLESAVEALNLLYEKNKLLNDLIPLLKNLIQKVPKLAITQYFKKNKEAELEKLFKDVMKKIALDDLADETAKAEIIASTPATESAIPITGLKGKALRNQYIGTLSEVDTRSVLSEFDPLADQTAAPTAAPASETAPVSATEGAPEETPKRLRNRSKVEVIVVVPKADDPVEKFRAGAELLRPLEIKYRAEGPNVKSIVRGTYETPLTGVILTVFDTLVDIFEEDDERKAIERLVDDLKKAGISADSDFSAAAKEITQLLARAQQIEDLYRIGAELLLPLQDRFCSSQYQYKIESTDPVIKKILEIFEVAKKPIDILENKGVDSKEKHKTLIKQLRAKGISHDTDFSELAGKIGHLLIEQSYNYLRLLRTDLGVDGKHDSVKNPWTHYPEVAEAIYTAVSEGKMYGAPGNEEVNALDFDNFFRGYLTLITFFRKAKNEANARAANAETEPPTESRTGSPKLPAASLEFVDELALRAQIALRAGQIEGDTFLQIGSHLGYIEQLVHQAEEVYQLISEQHPELHSDPEIVRKFEDATQSMHTLKEHLEKAQAAAVDIHQLLATAYNKNTSIIVAEAATEKAQNKLQEILLVHGAINNEFVKTILPLQKQLTEYAAFKASAAAEAGAAAEADLQDILDVLNQLENIATHTNLAFKAVDGLHNLEESYERDDIEQTLPVVREANNLIQKTSGVDKAVNEIKAEVESILNNVLTTVDVSVRSEQMAKLKSIEEYAVNRLVLIPHYAVVVESAKKLVKLSDLLVANRYIKKIDPAAQTKITEAIHEVGEALAIAAGALQPEGMKQDNLLRAFQQEGENDEDTLLRIAENADTQVKDTTALVAHQLSNAAQKVSDDARILLSSVEVLAPLLDVERMENIHSYIEVSHNLTRTAEEHAKDAMKYGEGIEAYEENLTHLRLGFTDVLNAEEELEKARTAAAELSPSEDEIEPVARIEQLNKVLNLYKEVNDIAPDELKKYVDKAGEDAIGTVIKFIHEYAEEDVGPEDFTPITYDNLTRFETGQKISKMAPADFHKAILFFSLTMSAILSQKIGEVARKRLTVLFKLYTKARDNNENGLEEILENGTQPLTELPGKVLKFLQDFESEYHDDVKLDDDIVESDILEKVHQLAAEPKFSEAADKIETALKAIIISAIDIDDHVEKLNDILTSYRKAESRNSDAVKALIAGTLDDVVLPMDSRKILEYVSEFVSTHPTPPEGSTTAAAVITTDMPRVEDIIIEKYFLASAAETEHVLNAIETKVDPAVAARIERLNQLLKPYAEASAVTNIAQEDTVSALMHEWARKNKASTKYRIIYSLDEVNKDPRGTAARIQTNTSRVDEFIEKSDSDSDSDFDTAYVDVKKALEKIIFIARLNQVLTAYRDAEIRNSEAVKALVAGTLEDVILLMDSRKILEYVSEFVGTHPTPPEGSTIAAALITAATPKVEDIIGQPDFLDAAIFAERALKRIPFIARLNQVLIAYRKAESRNPEAVKALVAKALTGIALTDKTFKLLEGISAFVHTHPTPPEGSTDAPAVITATTFDMDKYTIQAADFFVAATEVEDRLNAIEKLEEEAVATAEAEPVATAPAEESDEESAEELDEESEAAREEEPAAAEEPEIAEADEFPQLYELNYILRLYRKALANREKVEALPTQLLDDPSLILNLIVELNNTPGAITTDHEINTDDKATETLIINLISDMDEGNFNRAVKLLKNSLELIIANNVLTLYREAQERNSDAVQNLIAGTSLPPLLAAAPNARLILVGIARFAEEHPIVPGVGPVEIPLVDNLLQDEKDLNAIEVIENALKAIEARPTAPSITDELNSLLVLYHEAKNLSDDLRIEVTNKLIRLHGGNEGEAKNSLAILKCIADFAESHASDIIIEDDSTDGVAALILLKNSDLTAFNTARAEVNGTLQFLLITKLNQVLAAYRAANSRDNGPAVVEAYIATLPAAPDLRRGLVNFIAGIPAGTKVKESSPGIRDIFVNGITDSAIKIEKALKLIIANNILTLYRAALETNAEWVGALETEPALQENGADDILGFAARFAETNVDPALMADDTPGIDTFLNPLGVDFITAAQAAENALRAILRPVAEEVGATAHRLAIVQPRSRIADNVDIASVHSTREAVEKAINTSLQPEEEDYLARGIVAQHIVDTFLPQETGKPLPADGTGIVVGNIRDLGLTRIDSDTPPGEPERKVTLGEGTHARVSQAQLSAQLADLVVQDDGYMQIYDKLTKRSDPVPALTSEQIATYVSREYGAAKAAIAADQAAGHLTGEQAEDLNKLVEIYKKTAAIIKMLKGPRTKVVLLSGDTPAQRMDAFHKNGARTTSLFLGAAPTVIEAIHGASSYQWRKLNIHNLLPLTENTSFTINIASNSSGVNGKNEPMEIKPNTTLHDIMVKCAELHYGLPKAERGGPAAQLRAIVITLQNLILKIADRLELGNDQGVWFTHSNNSSQLKFDLALLLLHWHSLYKLNDTLNVEYQISSAIFEQLKVCFVNGALPAVGDDIHAIIGAMKVFEVPNNDFVKARKQEAIDTLKGSAETVSKAITNTVQQTIEKYKPNDDSDPRHGVAPIKPTHRASPGQQRPPRST